MRRKYIICFDLDNVICVTKSNNYKFSKPKKKVIKIIVDIVIEALFFDGKNQDKNL